MALQSSNEITKKNNKHGLIGLSQKVIFVDWSKTRVGRRGVALLKGNVNTQDFLPPRSNLPKRDSP